MRIGRERLIEIMGQLSGSFTPEAVDDLIPAYWEPADYFSFKKNQNLWNKVRQVDQSAARFFLSDGQVRLATPLFYP